MTELEIPELLKGSWRHAVFLTYSVDIPIFESALWRELNSLCTNKIILADATRFLAACSQYTQPGLVRHLNRLYVADGILVPQSAHAKLILLTNEEQGRLLVGSGNLGMQGYASGGELFTLYEYSLEAEQNLNAFVTVRHLLNTLIERRWIGSPATQRLQHMFEQTPWLYLKSHGASDSPVRHNLEQSLLSQLHAAVGAETVEDLYVLSPFYDPAAVALGELLHTLRPKQTTLLVQPGYTSLHPSAVEKVINEYRGQVSVRAFQRGDDNRYVHAKLYLVKTVSRAICLQGSPNLSQVAMLRTPPQGNIELANLLIGGRDEFDHLLGAIRIGAIIPNLAEAGLALEEVGEDAVAESTWYLIRSELHENRLILHYHGTPPDFTTAQLVIAGREFPLVIKSDTADRLELQLDQLALALFERAVPVSIHWSSAEYQYQSNPLFVCHLVELSKVLEADDAESTLPGFGDLALDDEEFERLLGELDAALMIDRRSVWQLVSHRAEVITDAEEDAPYLSYEEIDYDRIRQHPKIQQYLSRHGVGPGYERSRLQVILNAITSHFQGLVNPDSVQQMLDVVASTTADQATESEADAEQAETERTRRRMASQQRVRRLLINFIRRYLRGVRAKDFQQLVGSEVMTLNYVIFSHLLWRLLAKDWVEHSFVVASFVEIWRLFWGDAHTEGYWTQLSEAERTQMLQRIAEHHTDSWLLAAVYLGATLVRPMDKETRSLRLSLRKQWRSLLAHSPVQITDQVLETMCNCVASLFVYNPPRPTTIAAALHDLANYTRREEFLREVEQRFQLANHSCEIKRMTVKRPSLNREDTVECLVLGRGAVLSNANEAQLLLRWWMRIEPLLGYYRIVTFDYQQMAFYDPLEPSGVYWDRTTSTDFSEFSQLEPYPMAWDKPLAELQQYAQRLDASMTLKLPTHISSFPVTPG
jgi:hypothetical protein